ncbi:MAG: rod shape-determining protein MreC [Ruminococcaceae bacterium]|nr:rod shape-determining protein MreC [Oscillospiraceae bacterium]
MRYLFTKKVKIVLIVAMLLSVGLAIATNLMGVTVGDLAVQGILTPLRTGASALTDKAEQLYDYIFKYEQLALENETLREQLSQIQTDNRDAASIKRENDRLRELLELKKEHEDYELVDAYIITRTSNDWSYTFTVNRGSGSGIKEGMCAITETGAMVGVVTQVGSNYAVITSVLDSSLDISACIASSGYPGMVRGSYATGVQGMLRMDYLSSAAVIRNHDQVVTAGSTVYPKNLVLGTIVHWNLTDNGIAKYAILEPAADVATLEQVFVLTGFGTE